MPQRLAVGPAGADLALCARGPEPVVAVMSEPRAIPFAHLAGQRNDCPALSDAEREAQISLAWQALCAAATVDLQRAAFAQMRDLIGQRSPEQIERLERERGLR